MIRPTVAVLFVLGFLTNGSDRGFATAAPAGAKVRVVRVEGEAVDGGFVGVDGKGVVLEGAEAPIPLRNVRELHFAAETAPRALAEGAVGLRIVLRGGDVVRGALEAASVEDLTIKPVDFAALRLPFDAIRCIEADPASRGPCDEPGRLRPARKGTDIAYARSGDAFAGTLAEATMSGVVLEGNGAKQTLRWAELIVLHLDGTDAKPPEGLVAEFEMRGGSLLLGTDVTADAAAWRATLGGGIQLTVPRDGVAAVRWSGGSFARVDDLPYEATLIPFYEGLDPAFLEAWYGARADRTPSGCPLRIANGAYRHGIAVHAKSVVKVPLGKAYRRFTAAFGVDDEAVALGARSGSKGDVTARVLVDGKEVWSTNGSVKGGEPARPIGPIDVAGAETLVLEVGFGSDQHRLDRADWVDPVLVRAP
jgi:hypothetical protein